jgi:hypothetical protein
VDIEPPAEANDRDWYARAMVDPLNLELYVRCMREQRRHAAITVSR